MACKPDVLNKAGLHRQRKKGALNREYVQAQGMATSQILEPHSRYTIKSHARFLVSTFTGVACVMDSHRIQPRTRARIKCKSCNCILFLSSRTLIVLAYGYFSILCSCICVPVKTGIETVLLTLLYLEK